MTKYDQASFNSDFLILNPLTPPSLLVAVAGEKSLAVPQLSFTESVDTQQSGCSHSDDCDSSSDSDYDDSSTDWEDEERQKKKPGK